MTERRDRWVGVYCIAWTALLAVGYFGSQLIGLAPNPAPWYEQALPALTIFYWLLLAASVVYWIARSKP
jgi:hypothetical protein